MAPKIGISEKNLDHSIKLLSGILSNEMALYIKTRKFHWNVTGESFMELHKLFQGQYTELEETIDLVAERIGKLGGKTIGTMKEFSQHAKIKESPGKYPSQKEMLKELLQDHELVIIELRKELAECAYKDNEAGTADLFTGLIQQHESTAWILRRYLN